MAKKHHTNTKIERVSDERQDSKSPAKIHKGAAETEAKEDATSKMVRVNIIPTNATLKVVHFDENEDGTISPHVITPQPAKEFANKGQQQSNGIDEFLAKFKRQEKEAAQKRQETLKQLEKIKKEIQQSIKEDREERLQMAHDIGHRIVSRSVPQKKPFNLLVVPETVERNNHVHDLMSITSGTSFSSNSLVQNSHFVAVRK